MMTQQQQQHATQQQQQLISAWSKPPTPHPRPPSVSTRTVAGDDDDHRLEPSMLLDAASAADVAAAATATTTHHHFPITGVVRVSALTSASPSSPSPLCSMAPEFTTGGVLDKLKPVQLHRATSTPLAFTYTAGSHDAANAATVPAATTSTTSSSHSHQRTRSVHWCPTTYDGAPHAVVYIYDYEDTVSLLPSPSTTTPMSVSMFTPTFSSQRQSFSSNNSNNNDGSRGNDHHRLRSRTSSRIDVNASTSSHSLVSVAGGTTDNNATNSSTCSNNGSTDKDGIASAHEHNSIVKGGNLTGSSSRVPHCDDDVVCDTRSTMLTHHHLLHHTFNDDNENDDDNDKGIDDSKQEDDDDDVHDNDDVYNHYHAEQYDERNVDRFSPTRRRASCDLSLAMTASFSQAFARHIAHTPEHEQHVQHKHTRRLTSPRVYHPYQYAHLRRYQAWTDGRECHSSSRSYARGTDDRHHSRHGGDNHDGVHNGGADTIWTASSSASSLSSPAPSISPTRRQRPPPSQQQRCSIDNSRIGTTSDGSVDNISSGIESSDADTNIPAFTATVINTAAVTNATTITTSTANASQSSPSKSTLPPPQSESHIKPQYQQRQQQTDRRAIFDQPSECELAVRASSSAVLSSPSQSLSSPSQSLSSPSSPLQQFCVTADGVMPLSPSMTPSSRLYVYSDNSDVNYDVSDDDIHDGEVNDIVPPDGIVPSPRKQPWSSLSSPSSTRLASLSTSLTTTQSFSLTTLRSPTPSILSSASMSRHRTLNRSRNAAQAARTSAQHARLRRGAPFRKFTRDSKLLSRWFALSPDLTELRWDTLTIGERRAMAAAATSASSSPAANAAAAAAARHATQRVSQGVCRRGRWSRDVRFRVLACVLRVRYGVYVDKRSIPSYADYQNEEEDAEWRQKRDVFRAEYTTACDKMLRRAPEYLCLSLNFDLDALAETVVMKRYKRKLQRQQEQKKRKQKQKKQKHKVSAATTTKDLSSRFACCGVNSSNDDGGGRRDCNDMDHVSGTPHRACDSNDHDDRTDADNDIDDAESLLSNTSTTMWSQMGARHAMIDDEDAYAEECAAERDALSRDLTLVLNTEQEVDDWMLALQSLVPSRHRHIHTLASLRWRRLQMKLRLMSMETLREVMSGRITFAAVVDCLFDQQ